MGKPTLPSMELERSMNLQIHVMTVEETQDIHLSLMAR